MVNSQARNRLRSRSCSAFRYTLSITSWLRSSLKSSPQPCERKKDTSLGVNVRKSSVNDSSLGDLRKVSAAATSRRGQSFAILDLIIINSVPQEPAVLEGYAHLSG